MSTPLTSTTSRDSATASAYDFVMSFVASSDRYRRQYTSKWTEVLYNFMVEPYQSAGMFTTPFDRNQHYRQSRNNILLKDPETHRTIMLYASKIVRALFGDRRGEYIKARPVGWEDAPLKAPTATRLLHYDFSLPGHFRTMVEAVIDMLLFGTAFIEVGWEYREQSMPVREVTEDELGESESVTRVSVPVYDDPILRLIDINDFYPDPGRYRLQDMTGAVKRFKVNEMTARAGVRAGMYRSGAIDRAYRDGGSATEGAQDRFRVGIDQPRDADQLTAFGDKVGFEYYGQWPFTITDDDGVSASSGRITIINREVVRVNAWPYGDPALPWHSLVINPVQGRVYGISPAEVIRFDQEYIDAVKVLLAEAVIRQVHPPLAYDPGSDLDVAKLRVWKADAPIAIRGGPKSIGTLRYDADINAGFAMVGGMKVAMGEASGAVSGLGGEPGPDRESASVGVQRVQLALDRPELATMILERDCLPPIARALLRRNQQFLSTEGLRQRVGEQPSPIWIGEIMGDFDVEFVGSRVAMSRAEKLQSWDRLIAMITAAPPLAASLPWAELGPELIGDLLELPEVAAKMSDPATMMRNILVTQLMAGGAMGGAGGAGGPAQNGVPQSGEPAGMMPAQAGGGVVGAT